MPDTLTQLNPAIHDRLLRNMKYVEKHSQLIDVNAAALLIAVVEVHRPIRFDRFFADCPVMLEARNSFFQEHAKKPRKSETQLMMFAVGMNGEDGHHALVAKNIINILNGKDA